MDTLYSGNVHFQVDQGNGYWLTVNTLYNITGQVFSMNLRDMKRAHPDNRVRAVTDSGQLIDVAWEERIQQPLLGMIGNVSTHSGSRSNDRLKKHLPV